MHRVRSGSTLLRFRLAAVLLCLKYVFVGVTAILLPYALLNHNPELAWLGLTFGMVTLGVAVAQWVVGSQARCPLCMTPVLTGKGCSKHRNARTAFGSHRFRVALGILFRDSFMCPYCHEPTAMQVRVSRQG